MDTLKFILAAENVPFAVALAMMGMIALLEMAGMLIGAGLSDLLDLVLPDLDGLDGADGSLTTLSAVLSWFHIGRVPALMLLVAFLTGFGALGYALQGAVLQATGHMLPVAMASGAAVFAAIPGMHWIGGLLAAILPRDETSAVSSASFVGREAVITLGTAARGRAAEARLSDAHGQSHYVMVEPAADSPDLPQGTRIIIVSENGARFTAAPLP